MKDLRTRADVNRVITSFYASVREDHLLGPVFNSRIKDWDHHFDHLTDFWESNLFLVSHYSGNPIQVHQEVDKYTGHVIDQSYFVQWLKLWNETIDSLYQGEYATVMKNRARNMSTFIWIQMVKAR